MKRTVGEIRNRINELDAQGHEVVSIAMEDAIALSECIGDLHKKLRKARDAESRQRELANAAYANALLELEEKRPYVVQERI